MTLPHLCAPQSIGPARFTRLSSAKSQASGGSYVVAKPAHQGQMYRIAVNGPDGGVVGRLTLKPCNDGRMAIYDLYVVAAHRGQGLSRKLMARAASQARALGGKKLWLTADANPGEGLDNQKLYQIYQNMGFCKTRLDPGSGRQEMEAPL